MVYEDHIKHELEEYLQVGTQILDKMFPIVEIARLIVDTLKNGGRVFLFGNGGSAADAQHIAAEFVNRFLIEREALPAIALTTDTSILTSIGNDRGFEHVFARQVAALGHKGDIAVALSTSGDSLNVLKAVEVARAKGMRTVGFTGRSRGRLRECVDICFQAPSDKTPRIQEAHIAVWHIICAVVERELFAPQCHLESAPGGEMCDYCW